MRLRFITFFVLGMSMVAAGFGLVGVIRFPVVHAQVRPSLSVGPEKFEFPVNRGEVREEVLRVANRSEVPLPVHLRVVRFAASDETGGIRFTERPEDISFDIIQWIELPAQDMILAPGESRRVPFTLTVPENAEVGGKYGAILVEPQLPETYFAEDAARVFPRVAALFLLDVPRFQLDGEAGAARLEEFAVEEVSPVLSETFSRIASLFRAPTTVFAGDPGVSIDVLDRGTNSFTVRVANEDITHIRPSGTLAVHNSFGRTVAKAELPETTILPGTVRKFPVAFSSEGEERTVASTIAPYFALGKYSATVVLESTGPALGASGTAEPLIATISYWVFPWQSTLAALFVLLLLGYGIFRLRYRLRAAFRAFFHSA